MDPGGPSCAVCSACVTGNTNIQQLHHCIGLPRSHVQECAANLMWSVEGWLVLRVCGWPQAVLICGWREEAFMSDMLREMDHGPSALPAGSQLTLFNTSTNVEIMARVKTRNRSELGLIMGTALDPAM